MEGVLRQITRTALPFGLLFHAVVCVMAATPTADYLAARDRAIAALATTNGEAAADQAREQAALDELEQRVRLIVGPIGIPGFPEPGDSNLGTLSPGVDLGKLDGVTAKDANGTTVYVSTSALLDAWLAGHRNWWGRSHAKLPQNAAAAFKISDFYTQAISPDAAATIFAELPLAHGPEVRSATALLLAFAQDGPAPNPPDELVVAVVRDGRAILLVRPLNLVQIPSCKSAWDRDNKVARGVLDDYTKSSLRDGAMFGKYVRLDAAANDNFIRCFGERFRPSADYEATRERAQALLDRVSGR
jgi:hypothetical protein